MSDLVARTLCWDVVLGVLVGWIVSAVFADEKLNEILAVDFVLVSVSGDVLCTRLWVGRRAHEFTAAFQLTETHVGGFAGECVLGIARSLRDCGRLF